jgi:hypothetical protein
VIFKALVAQAGAAAEVVADEDGDVVTGAELEELAPLEGAVDALDAEDDEDDAEDEHPAASAAQASTAASRPAPATDTARVIRPAAGFPFPERPTFANTPIPSPGGARCAVLDSMTTGRPGRL